ncbi:MAG: hypothetical protein L3J08_05695 [Flavobacteriaceae bacterium]|nr:hypothetical protein [Flavobacteriaceae bacterium]
MKKPINILLNASIYYVVFRFLIWFVFILNRNLAETVNYHYSNSLFWYFIWFVFPILTAILIPVKFQIQFLKQVGSILLPILLVGTLLIGSLNNDYWGYWYKRPTVFNELKEVASIISITDIKKQYDQENFSIEIDTSATKKLYGRENLYYGNFDRPIMTFLDNAPINPSLFYWFKITKDTTKKIKKPELLSITNAILKNGFLKQPKLGYEKSGNRFNGKIIEFKTNKDNSFYHIALKSGETENDHYPFYEILINTKNLSKIIKKQIFYTDVAGIEGFEYTNLAGLVEFLVLIIIGLFIRVINGLKLIIKRKGLATL